MAVFTIGSSSVAGGGGGGGLSPSADETITGYWTFQNATDTVLTVQAGSAQGSYLQQWLDNAGNPLAFITNSAEIHGGLFVTEGSNSGMQYNKRSDGSAAYTMYSGSGEMSFYSFTAGGTTVAFSSNGNAIFGNTADENYRLDVSKSGSAGTARFYDQTATTGNTLVSFRSGAGQSGPLAIFYDVANAPVIRLGANGEIETVTGSGATYGTQTTGNKYSVNSSGLLQFSSSSQAYDTKDTGIGRNAAGVLEVNNGTLGTLRDVYARAFRAEANTVGSLPAAAAGNAGQIQYVTDANATTIGSTVAAGGSNKVLVWSNGSAWHIMAN